jgi:RNA polymerase sigma factor (sigma-70 family)
MTTSPNVREAIEDLVNEIFLRLTQELSDAALYDSPDSLRATLREMEEEWRKSTSAQSHASEAKELRIAAVLQTLSPDERDALFLHLGRGMRCAEIARQTGISRWAVLNDLVRAYSRLRLRLGDVDFRTIYRR